MINKCLFWVTYVVEMFVSILYNIICFMTNMLDKLLDGIEIIDDRLIEKLMSIGQKIDNKNN